MSILYPLHSNPPVRSSTLVGTAEPRFIDDSWYERQLESGVHPCCAERSIHYRSKRINFGVFRAAEYAQRMASRCDGVWGGSLV